MQGKQLDIGWDGVSYTGKITASNGAITKHRILRNVSTTSTVHGFGWDTNGLYVSVDSSKIYITTKQ